MRRWPPTSSGTARFPNKDGLAFFREEILPHLRNGTGPRIHWVGRASEEEIRRHREQYGLELAGYVPDVRPYIRDAACYVVPLRVGGGTRIKILDAWAMGKAVVSTSVGCEGLAAVDGENIVIRDRPSDFANAVRDVLADPELRRRLGEAARQTVERTVLFPAGSFIGPAGRHGQRRWMPAPPSQRQALRGHDGTLRRSIPNHHRYRLAPPCYLAWKVSKDAEPFPIMITAEQLESAALQLPSTERAHLAERLIASLDAESEIQRAWIAEAERRYERYRTGESNTIPAAQVLDRMRAKFR